MLSLLPLHPVKITFATNMPFGLPVWLPILVFLILILAIFWFMNSFQEEKPEYLPPWAILPAIETSHSSNEPSQRETNPGFHSENPPKMDVIEVPLTPSTTASDTSMVSPVFSSSENLEKIEGIGPVIARLLVSNGITTFDELAHTDQNKLTEILTTANLRIADPGTWSKQAELAAAGRWDALKQLQDQLKAGRTDRS